MAVSLKKKSSSEKLITPETQNKIPFSIIEAYKNIRTNLISVLSFIDIDVKHFVLLPSHQAQLLLQYNRTY